MCLIVINRFVFVMEMHCVFCEVLIDYLRVKLQRLKHNGIAASHPLFFLIDIHALELNVHNTFTCESNVYWTLHHCNS